MNIKRIVLLIIICIANKQVASEDDIATPRNGLIKGIVHYPEPLPKDFLPIAENESTEIIDLADEDKLEYCSLYTHMMAQFNRHKAFIVARLATHDEYLESSKDPLSKKTKTNIHYLGIPNLHSYFFGQGQLLPKENDIKLKNIFYPEKKYADVHYFITYPTLRQPREGEQMNHDFDYVGSTRSLLDENNLFLICLLQFHYSKDPELVASSAIQLRDAYNGEINLGAIGAPNKKIAEFYTVPSTKEKNSRCVIQ